MMFPFVSSGIYSHIPAILALLSVTVIYTWPLLRQLTSAIPGSFELTDTTETIWSVGWVHQALSSGENLWQTDRLFAPFGADLRFNVFGLLPGLIAYPFVASLGVVGASNLVIVLTMCLNGIFAYILVWKHTRHATASLLASVCHVLSLAVIWHFSAGRNALPSVWIVSAALICAKSLLDKPSVWNGFLLGSALLAVFFTDLQVTVFALMWVLFYVAAHLPYNDLVRALRSLAAPLLIAISMFVSAVGLVLLPVIPRLGTPEFPPPSLENASDYVFSIQDFASPRQIPFIYGYDFLALTVIAPFLLKRQGGYRFWLLGSLVFFVLSLGPYLKPTHIPLPYALASIWPPLLNFRAAYRFVIPATIGLTLVAGRVLARLLPGITMRGVVVPIGMAFILLRLGYSLGVLPFETQVYPNYSFYREAGLDSEDYAILEIPFGVRSGLDQIGQGGERLQYYQHLHQKRILNGSLARLPNSLFESYRSHPILMFFSGDLSVDGAGLGGDLTEVLEWTQARYILVHRSLISGEQAEEIESFLNGQSRLQRIGLERDLVIYEVIP